MSAVQPLKQYPKWDTEIGSSTDPNENFVRARAQSILTMDGELGPLLPYEQALDVVKWATRNEGWEL